MRILIAYEKGEPDYYAIPDDAALGRVAMKLIEERDAAGYYTAELAEADHLASVLQSRTPRDALQFLLSRNEAEYERIAIVNVKEI